MESQNQAVTIDSLFQELGDCGLFQLLMIITIHGAGLVSRWAVSFMQYGIYNPGWTCMDQAGWDDHTNVTYTNPVSANVSVSGNHTLGGFSSSCDVYENCQNIVYSSESSTIVTEWNLACGKTWIISMIISLDVVGQTIGTFLAGVWNDRIGRKLTHIIGLILLAVFNLIAMFSTSWPIFTVIRFFVGVFAGYASLTNYVYPMEFLTDKCRAITTALPFGNFGSLLFAFIALWLKDWRYIHLVTAIFSLVFVVTTIWAPESIRWLTLKGKTEKAVQVVHKIERTNKMKPGSLNVIHSISGMEIQGRNDSSNSSILDLYRRGFWKRTTAITYGWIHVVMCLTIVQFGIASLSGDFYINLILFNSIPVVTLPLLPFLIHYFGRKLTYFILLGVSTVSLLCLILIHFLTLDNNEDLAISTLSILLYVFLDGEVALIMLCCVEVYPTNLRSLSYGYANTLARIGGILAPFLIPHDKRTLFIAHIVMAVLTLIHLPLLCLLPETKGRPLDEYEEME